jgi:hypothetical protein
VGGTVAVRRSDRARGARAPRGGGEPQPRPLAGRGDPLPVCYQGSDLPVLTKTRATGLRLVATDGPFSTGSGPVARGSTLGLIMAMAGRGAYCDELQGDGAATLRERGQTP